MLEVFWNVKDPQLSKVFHIFPKGSLKKKKKNDGLNPQWGGGFWSKSTFHVFFFTFNVKKYV